MKKILCFTIILLWVGFEVAYAQNQKIGFVDTDVIMQNIPEYSGVEQRLDLLSENWRQEIRELEEKIAQLQEDFEARELLFTDEVREERLQEINAKTDELDRLIESRFGPEGEYFSRQKELLEPIQRRIFEALNSVAERENFDYVFDRAQDSRILFVRQQWNLTDEVMLELGLEPMEN
ncbi:OmpH family outer membrane protein [Rhodohalobacter sp.]|uniref:OmpH family outer membrane protein n=1 Tax=Rhodohalobacter sp. TaxID=1974210 RepID=UPI002ACE6FB7|nr:OmpH family outer membrane protein [Rhodohalobacter sp.]MDZ7756674.1 OmpH family outer membrane protein [Rhodohalobacter sp.]